MMKISSATLIEHVQDVFSKLNSPNRRLQGMGEAWEYLETQALAPDAELDREEAKQFIWLLYAEAHVDMPEGSPMLSENFVKAKAGAVFDVISAAINTDSNAETINFGEGAGETEAFEELMQDRARVQSVYKQLIEKVYTLTDEEAEEAFDYMDEDDNKTIDIQDAKIAYEREVGAEDFEEEGYYDYEQEDFNEEDYNAYMMQMFGTTSVDLATFKKGMDATVQCSEELADVYMNVEGDPAQMDLLQNKYVQCVQTELKKTTTTAATTTAPSAVTTTAPSAVTTTAPAAVTTTAPAVVTEEAPAVVTEEAPAVVTEEAPAVVTEEALLVSPVLTVTFDMVVKVPEEELPRRSLSDAVGSTEKTTTIASKGFDAALSNITVLLAMIFALKLLVH